MQYKRLPQSKLADFRAQQMEAQGRKCPISGWYLTADTAVADHCHRTGMHRGTLHSWINSCLGRIENAARSVGRDNNVPAFLRACAEYIEKYEQHPTFIFHHTHRTDEEKRLKRNKKSRARYAAKKAAE